MDYLRIVSLCLTLVTLSIPTAFAGQKMGISEKIQLQASMQTHIEARLISGAYLHVQKKTGEVKKLYPVTAHPMILKMGPYFVLCSDFRDVDGKQANIDFYMARRGKGFVVFDALIDERTGLQRLMRAGKASRVN
jgi:hypothetical protein